MRLAVFFLPILILKAAPATLPDVERLAHLNYVADQLLAAYKLDQAEPVVEEALDLATKVGPSYEAAAHVRVYDVYTELARRDTELWNSLAFPHILAAAEYAKKHPVAHEVELGVKYVEAALTAAGLRESSGFGDKTFDNYLSQLILAQGLKTGLLSRETALAYHALTMFPYGSSAQSQALNACELLVDTSVTTPPAPEFAPLLVRCADLKRTNWGYLEAIAMAQLARRTAASGGPRWAHEIVESYIIEAEAETSLGHSMPALAAIESAVAAARKGLGPANEIWERIYEDHASMAQKTGDAIQAGQEWKAWKEHADQRRKASRIQAATLVTAVKPRYTLRARELGIKGTTVVLLLISPKGESTVKEMFQVLPEGLGETTAEAARQCKFNPWTKDGKPVAGVVRIQFSF